MSGSAGGWPFMFHDMEQEAIDDPFYYSGGGQPADCRPESVREAFLLAHELGLKGVTVYRYGSKGGQALSLVHDERVPDCRECAV